MSFFPLASVVSGCALSDLKRNFLPYICHCCSHYASFTMLWVVGQIARTFWLSMPLVEELLLYVTLKVQAKEDTIHEFLCTSTLIGYGTAASIKVY